MQALILSENKELYIKDVEKSKPKANEVLIKIKASSINHRELWIQKGLYPGMTLPCILGADGAGVIEEVGSKVDQTIIGTEVIIYPAYEWGENEEAPTRSFRVLGMPDPGTMADYITVPLSNIFTKPKYLSWEEAAATPVASLTAWRALTKHGSINNNSKVLITGIGGGVAQAGLQIAKAFNAQVYVTSSNLDKINDAIFQGASGGVLYTNDNWAKELKKLSQGIDIVLDSSPAANFDDYFNFMNYGGRIVAYGSTGSPKTSISISKFFLRHIQFIGTAMGSKSDFNALLNFMERNKIRPRIHKSFPFHEAIKAFDYLRKGHQIGKIVLSH